MAEWSQPDSKLPLAVLVTLSILVVAYAVVVQQAILLGLLVVVALGALYVLWQVLLGVQSVENSRELDHE